jgi:8-oxo-dGTP pyrophosphatase MutT (NUDIX family)
MTGSSILPATVYKNKVYFLFGKENPMEDSAKGFSDFGGGVEKGESIYSTALREGGEELSGFLGDGKQIQKHIKKHGGVHKLVLNDSYHVHIMYLPYDGNLPKYYNQNHRFLWDRMNRKWLNKTKLFEKIEIDWFSYADLKKRRKEFRGFYQEFLDVLTEDEVNVKRFLKKAAKRGNKTRHRRNQTGRKTRRR